MASAAGAAAAAPDLEQGPLWDTMKRQLYRSEVSHVKRLVGEDLIQQNRVMWDEVTSLRQILSDFEQETDELAADLKQQVDFCSSQHRDLLKRQAHIILEDLRGQAVSCGHVLEDMVPELSDETWRAFFADDGVVAKLGRSGGWSCRSTPPATPSTRPPSSCGGAPDVGGSPPLPLGRPLGVDELGPVAASIREAVEAEQESLLAAIREQTQRFEAEDLRRSSSKATAGREPSTAQLQQFVRKLQDVAVSPTLRTLALAGPALAADEADGDGEFLPPPRPIGGGANVRRLKALIAQRRRCTTSALAPLGAVPEAAGGASASSCAPSPGVTPSGRPGKGMVFDPFFDDPFDSD